MTTITYKDRKIASDGQISFGDRIDNYSLKKVRKINGCLVGGAGRLSSVLQFFDWFQEWSDAQQVQGESPHVKVFVPEGIDDEDFYGLVVFADEVIFMYEGGKKSYQMTGSPHYAIGSGSDYALAAMDAGASADEAVAIAITRDVYTGGEIFIEELDPEPIELTRQVAESMEKSELLDMLFGEDVEIVEHEKDEIIFQTSRVVIDTAEKVIFINPENGDTLDEITLQDSELDSPSFKRVCKALNRKYLDLVASEIGMVFEQPAANKSELLDAVLDCLNDAYFEKLQERADAE